MPLVTVTYQRDDGLTPQPVPLALHVVPVPHVPQVRSAQFAPGSGPHTREPHADVQVVDAEQTPTKLLQVLPTGHVPHCPPHPLSPHARPVQNGVHTHVPAEVHTDEPEHRPLGDGPQ